VLSLVFSGKSLLSIFHVFKVKEKKSFDRWRFFSFLIASEVTKSSLNRRKYKDSRSQTSQSKQKLQLQVKIMSSQTQRFWKQA
jgi:hypothetical protein